MPNHSWDTIVIGSGAGGLVAAVALARAGQRVLVLEQHYLPGGWTHSFTLEGHRFSPGVHYVGELQPGGGIRRMYEGLGLGGELEFLELNPDGLDHFLIADQRVDQPRGRERWIERLKARFPDEQAGIDRYFAVISALAADLVRGTELLEFPAVLLLPLRAPTLLRRGFSTLGSLLDECVKDPLLRAVLSAQCGNHGLPPSRVSLPMHAGMTAHYWNGGFYPRGGAKRIPLACIHALRRHQGELRLRARVARILVERGRAVGVELQGGEIIHADNVLSNADPAVTFGRLLPEKLARRERWKLRRTEYSVGLLSLFCATDLDLRALGYDSGNYWWYRSTDVEGIYSRAEKALPAGAVDGLFLTITTLKDPGHDTRGQHVLEMFTFVPWAPFEQWRDRESGERGDEYDSFKERLADQVLEAADHVIPGLSDHLTFLSIGTPLTNDFYCETHRGAAYGTAKTPWQLGPFSFPIRTHIPGLFQCGASTISHGVGGASMSGLIAAKEILGLRTVEECLGPPDGSLRVRPSEGAEPLPDSQPLEESPELGTAI